MSKFINKETIEYVRAKNASTLQQQIENIRERLNLEAEHNSSLYAKLERDTLNQSHLLSHLGTNMLEMQKIVDNKVCDIHDCLNDQETLRSDAVKKLKQFKTKVIITLGVIITWLTMLSILILRKG